MAARILVVEDHETNLALVSYLLTEFGHDPVGKSDPAAGLETALSEPFDLMLIDILMPGMDGFEVARRIRTDPSRSHTPLVALTALAMVGDRGRILEAGFEGYISKPINPRTFVQEVDAFLPAEKRSQKTLTLVKAEEATHRAEVLRQGVVLVVDDVPENIGVVRAAIEPFGYHVVGANSVVNAFAVAQERQPDLVVTDVHLAGQTGFDLLDKLKSHVETQEIPIIFVTSSEWSDRDIASAHAAGVERLLERPIDPRRLLDEIQRAVKTKR